MLESITIFGHNSGTEKTLDIGRLAEAMLFYGEVNLVTNIGVIKQLVDRIEIDDLISVICDGFLKIRVIEGIPGILAEEKNGIPTKIDAGVVTLADNNFQSQLLEFFEKQFSKTGKVRRSAQKILNKSTYHEYPETLADDTRHDFKNSQFVRENIVSLIKQACPEFNLTEDTIFELRQNDQGSFELFSNINFVELQRQYQKYVSPSHSQLTPQFLLAHFISSRAGLILSSQFNSDLATNPMNSCVVSSMASNVAKKISSDQGTINYFQEISQSFYSLSEFINQGTKSDFSKFRGILDKSREFRKWLSNNSSLSHEELVKDYIKICTSESWVEKLPAKGTRFLIFSGLGALIDAVSTGGLATLVSLGLSGTDSLIVDKLIEKWKPHQFLNKTLKPLLTPKL